MNFVWVLLLTLFSLRNAKRCDKFVSGSAWVHSITGMDEGDSYSGCKKGCYTNGTLFNDDGIKKCEKCSEIKDETNCTFYGATCRWSKGGKCVAQTCPNIAKNVNAGALELEQEDGGSNHGRVARFKECLNGSPREQYFNNLYIQDYRAHQNDKFAGLSSGMYCPPQNTNCGYNCNSSSSFCGVNGSLDPTSQSYNSHVCDDRIYPESKPTDCRILPSINKEICETDYTSRTWYPRYISISDNWVWENYTAYCLYSQSLILDSDKTDINGDSLNISDEDYRKLYQYNRADYCNHQRELRLKECQYDFDSENEACYLSYSQTTLTPPQFDHGTTVAFRAACHYVYGCMYSRSNNRCSVWSVWAFVLTLVIVVLVVVGAVAGALGFFVLRK